ncbi:hypothetical protein PROSTU_02053 [Providencia stuartii ATCC 25827]|uniref:Uncharacterized protein n=1 Tax=Providencia stuartii ATCC 25827 TaxID=471874 RepID=A0AA86YYN8_PROST|nr:hypothetical protein PROSTU_02053 [Providencia stuartii ATCC 25827]
MFEFLDVLLEDDMLAKFLFMKTKPTSGFFTLLSLALWLD